MSIRTHVPEDFSLDAYMAVPVPRAPVRGAARAARPVAVLPVAARPAATGGFFSNMPIPASVAEPVATTPLIAAPLAAARLPRAPALVVAPSGKQSTARAELATAQRELARYQEAVGELNRRLSAAGDRISVLNTNRAQEVAAASSEISVLTKKVRSLTETNSSLSQSLRSVHEKEMHKDTAEVTALVDMEARLNAAVAQKDELADSLKTAVAEADAARQQLVKVEAKNEAQSDVAAEAWEQLKQEQVRAEGLAAEIGNYQARLEMLQAIQEQPLEPAAAEPVAAAAEPVAPPAPVPEPSAAFDSPLLEMAAQTVARSARLKSAVRPGAIAGAADVARMVASASLCLGPCPVKGHHCCGEHESVGASLLTDVPIDTHAAGHPMLDSVLKDFKERFWQNAVLSGYGRSAPVWAARHMAAVYV